MNLGQRLVDLTTLTDASPFTGAGMSLVTALVALGILVFLRRLLPVENRDHGGVLKIFLAVDAPMWDLGNKLKQSLSSSTYLIP